MQMMNGQGIMWMPTRPPTLAHLMAWHLQPVPMLPMFAVLLLGLYLFGVRQLHQRGVHWPLGRTLWWLLGVATIWEATATGLDGYGMELFSVHMVQHMTLSMFAPIFLVLGAPMTLLLRSLPATHNSRWNVRRILLLFLHSRFARFITHPIVTGALFLMSLYGLYFTPIFDFLMRTMWGHNIMLVHFILIGMLYFWGVVGVDPSPRRYSNGDRNLSGAATRIFELFATTPFHAFFGVVVMMSTTLIVHWYAVPVPAWGIAPLSDQRVGGGIAWATTELPTLIVLSALFWQWQKSEARHERVADRKVLRNGDIERVAYNGYLASLAARDDQTTPHSP
ncbi:MAG: cytochrome c oxidase assembly protein [Microbacteriaceae bacterium]|nr:MAG: cytochrome c oxidase assembly protein [Microbacteriaceae bacterium]